MIVPERIMKSGKVCPAFQIDDDLAPMILRLKWRQDKDGYLRSSKRLQGEQTRVKLHRFVFMLRHGHWPNHQIDHINRDKLDNRSQNLRDVTAQQNTDNGGGSKRDPKNEHLPKGVYFRCDKPRPSPYFVYVRINSKLKYLGSFATVEEASVVAAGAKQGNL